MRICRGVGVYALIASVVGLSVDSLGVVDVLNLGGCLCLRLSILARRFRLNRSCSLGVR